VPGPVPEWRRAARDDLLAIVDYIADDSPVAAQALKDDIEAKVAALPDHPKLYRAGRVEGTREMVVRGNYLVIYAESKTAISTLRVLHGARNGRRSGAESSALLLKAGLLSAFGADRCDRLVKLRGWNRHADRAFGRPMGAGADRLHSHARMRVSNEGI
jgi:toxin ParE1/3/4